MEKVDRILRHPYYEECVRLIGQLEAERKFCRHDRNHFLDVARIAWILNMEEKAELPKELIYAAALLHDIGRHEQYLRGIPHDEASARIAQEILTDCGFSREEREMIVSAILQHRSGLEKTNALSEFLCRADKLSRTCFCCAAESECNWSAEKKNLVLKY